MMRRAMDIEVPLQMLLNEYLRTSMETDAIVTPPVVMLALRG